MNARRASAPTFEEQLAQRLDGLLALSDEADVDPLWARARAAQRDVLLRPAKHVRPRLLALGYQLLRPGDAVPDAVLESGAALEALHGFMLIHDDVADRAAQRRGGPALHRALGGGHFGDQQAIVLGDHLFARAIEAMLAIDHPAAARNASYLLQVCRYTAAGQLLDLSLSRLPLGAVSVFQLLKVAQMKTARYGFSAPLVMGATLAGAPPEALALLERLGRQVGTAFQLRDDLLGLFGDGSEGKPGDGDYAEGKRTFPVIAAYLRAGEDGRQALQALWDAPVKDAEATARARAEVERHGGKSTTQRVVRRLLRAAGRNLNALPATPARETLAALAAGLER